MTAEGRARRAAEADALCAQAYAAVAAPLAGSALVAVGGYGRAELAPHSDLDVVLVHDEGCDLGDLAEKLWYPLWDSGARLDHSTRSFPEMLAAAESDLRVALGLLVVRHLAGDPNLTLRLRTTMLADWRRSARERLPALRTMVDARHEIVGELAHAAVPDLKEAEGGLRDATALKALVASWLVDVPHVELERSRMALLDVRDVHHHAAGRPTDRIAPEAWEEIAAGCGLADAAAAQTHVRELGRRLTHLSRLTWRRVDSVLERPKASGSRRPALTPLGHGVALAAGEVVLDGSARPDRDPLLLLRAAVEAAERDIVLAPATAARLVRSGLPLPDPWPREATHLLVRLLASGPGLLGVWETLEETGALERILPEWERIRLLPHASTIHRFTVDRHVVETCIEASKLIRQVARPDVLMVAALLHDIGKGGLTEHSVAGEPIARAVGVRLGFDEETVDLIATLVRWHLLLTQTATTRDPDDPATVAEITRRIATPEALSLLTALSEADARAASPQAWTTWRAGLVRALAERSFAALVAQAAGGSAPRLVHEDITIPAEVRRDHASASFDVEEAAGGARLTVVSGDRVGLLADVAASLALQRASVRGARAWNQNDVAFSVWEVADAHLDPAVLRQRFEAIVAGRTDPATRLRAALNGTLPPAVAVHPEASSSATVLEVRATDRPGVLYLVLAALAELGVSVRSAHVDTVGPQVVDVFYLQELGAGALSECRAAAAAHAVRAALTDPS
jgi:[protein-PII] uridylyltransferase